VVKVGFIRPKNKQLLLKLYGQVKLQPFMYRDIRALGISSGKLRRWYLLGFLEQQGRDAARPELTVWQFSEHALKTLKLVA
jgi:hypothetical protein